MRLAWYSPKPERYPWLVGLMVVLAAALGFSAGNRQQSFLSSELKSGFIAPAGKIDTQILYNRMFADPPTKKTNEAWHALYPTNGGFIRHPDLAPNYAGISVFHQLHCLQALYDLYYDTDTGHNGHVDASGGHHGHGEGSDHTRHCFDYLRQSLMCHADTNLEQFDHKIGGVTGWGPKTCRDYSAVVKFANEWGWGPSET